jgi:hypothetical protein
MQSNKNERGYMSPYIKIVLNRLLLACSITLSFNACYAAPGCMDNSYRLTQHNDSKDYNYVACNCPCEKKYHIIERKSTCSKCGHFRDPRLNMFLMKSGPMLDCPKVFSSYACAKRAGCIQ